MSYPIVPNKYELSPLLTAEHMIEFRRKQGGLRDLAAPREAVLCLYKGVMRHFAWKYASRRVRGFLGDVFLLKRTGGKIGVLGNFGIGAPAIAGIAEEFMAWGTRRFVILSLAGGLQPEHGTGSVIVADRALRDEGTSYHYLAPSRDVRAPGALASHVSGALARRGIENTVGGVWSTDAPYRETWEEASLFQGEGVKAVDMESAGLFAVAQARGCEATSVFVIGDSLAGPRWSAPPDMRALHLRLKEVFNALLASLTGPES